jgi:hypothetical protein
MTGCTRETTNFAVPDEKEEFAANPINFSVKRGASSSQPT